MGVGRLTRVQVQAVLVRRAARARHPAEEVVGVEGVVEG